MTLPRTALALSLVALSACLRLDNFVFLELPLPDDDTDLMAKSVVPKDLRQEINGPIKSADGTVVDAYLLTHAAGDGSASLARAAVGIVYAHGQSNNMETDVPRTDILWQQGYTVLAYDARGYGKTQGTPSESTHYADARAAREYLESRNDLGMSADTVGLYARSLGTLFFTKIAAERPPKALVLESPVLSIQQIINDSMSIDTPIDWFIDSHMDNSVELPLFAGALFIMHGTADTYVNFKYGQELSNLADPANGGHANPNVFWPVDGANHDDVPCVSFTPAKVENDCTGGFSQTYDDKVNGFYDNAFGITP